MFVFGFEVPPIDQKRMVAFINEFITSTVNFLNEFMKNTEEKFVEFELKMQKIEASLMIVEAKVFRQWLRKSHSNFIDNKPFSIMKYEF